MKRFLSLLLIALLLIAVCLLSGCQNESVISEPRADLPEALKNVSFDNHLTISIGFWEIQDMVNNIHSDAVLTYIENMFNITIEPISVNWPDYEERYKILSATRSLPDVFANVTISSSDNNDSASLDNLILSNSIRSLPKNLSNYPNVEELLMKCGNVKSSDGNYYIIPRLSFQEPILESTDAAMLVRKDWMQNLGLSEPKSLSEFIDLVCAFANNDPDGNGLDDTIGYNVNNRIALGKWVMLGIAPECNVYSWIETKDGDYIPSYLTKDFIKVITVYRNLYESGGLDPDFYTKKSTDAVNDFVSGKLGALEFKSSPSSVMKLEAQWKLYQDIPFEDCVDVLHIFPADDGNSYCNSSNIFWSETLFSSNIDDEKIERVLYLYNYLLSVEGTNLVKYGIEGVDYEKINGEYKSLLDTDGTSLLTVLHKKYPSLLLFANIASWGGIWDDFDDNELNDLRYGEYAMELARKDLLWNVDNTIQIDRPYDFLLMPKESTEYFNTETVINDFTRVIIGTEDPLIMWDSIVSGYFKNGLETYISRQNEKYSEFSKKGK